MDDIKNICNKIIKKYLAKNKKIAILIGVGEIKNNVTDFKKSINESMGIIRIMKLLHGENVVKIYPEMLSYIFVYKMKDTEIAKKLYHSIFDSLTSYDIHHNCNLVDVLREYVMHSRGNITSVANNLYLHRNTIIYRLNKIEEISGKSLKDQESIFQFMMGFYLEGLYLKHV